MSRINTVNQIFYSKKRKIYASFLRLLLGTLVMVAAQNAMAFSGTLNFSGNSVPLGNTVNDGEANSIDISGVVIEIYSANLDGDAYLGASWQYFMGNGQTDLDDGIADFSGGGASIIIRTQGGEKFSFSGIEVFDDIGAHASLKFEGFRNGVSTGSETLTLDSADRHDIFTQSNGLTAAKFQYVDEVRISDPNTSNVYALIDTIVFEEAVPPAPTITSAIYDAFGGALIVNGTNFSSVGGAINDVIAGKFALTGEGGSTYTLADTGNVEISSATSFTLMLSATDRAAVNLILNNNGNSSTGGTSYNLAGAAGYISAAGATADLTGNGITVSNTMWPTITSATYDGSTGVLVVTGADFKSFSGPGNDIVANKFTFTGEGGSTWTLTDTANVEITSGTSFTMVLSATDRAGVNMILNKNGTRSIGATTYNLAASEDWALGANAAVTVADLTGNGITVSNVVDSVAPTATIVVADMALAVGETSLVTFTFSEAVTGFTNADLTSANGILSAVSSSDGGITWTATLTPIASVSDATNVITLDNTGVADAAGNAGTGTTNSNNFVIDTVRPTAVIVVADTALAVGETSLVTVTFSEAVAGFTNADLTAANGTLSALSSADGGITWTATLTPAAGISDSTNVITLANTGVVDAAGNVGTGTTDSNNYAIDSVPPTAVIVVADTALAVGEMSLVTVTFSEAVTGFTNADLTAANGTLSALSSADGGITWTATYTPTASISDTTNVLTLDNTGVADAAGNAGTGSTDSNNYAIDTARPTAAIVVADGDLAIGETSLVTFTFSEAVTGFTNADLTITNGTLSAVSSADGGITWTATLTPAAGISDSTNVITFANTGVADAAGNTGTGSTDSNNYAIDNLRPTASIVVADMALTAGETSLVTFTFSEAVTGFTNADLTAVNGTLSAVSSADGGITWTATFTPTASITDTTNVITLDSTGVTDAAGNAGTGTTGSNNFVIDTVRPTAVIVVADTALAVGETSLVTITFNEAVTGFTNADLTAANGTLSALSSADGGITWTTTFTPTASISDPSNVITLDNTVVADAAGNTGTGTTDSNNYAIDTVHPTAVIVVADTALAIGETSLVTITFSEAVAGFTNADLTIANGTLSAVSSSDGGITWTATLTPTASVSEAANIITLDNTGVADVAGNAGTGTTVSNNYSIDTSAPVVSSVGVPTDGTYSVGQKLDFAVNISENVTVNTTGGTPQLALTIGANARQAVYTGGSGTPSLMFRYTVQAGDEDTDGITLAPAIDANGGTLRDTVGNDLNLALSAVGNIDGVLVDTVAPQGHSASFDQAVINAAVATQVSFTFADAEVGADYVYTASSSGGDTSVSGSGTLAGMTDQVSGLDVSELDDGTLTLSVTLTDAAGNTASPVTGSAILDTTSPTITLSTSAEAIINSAFEVTVQFDEAVTGFEVGDITVANANLDAFSGSGDSYTVTVTPVDDGPVTVDINTGVAEDSAGNDTTAATQLSRIYDGTAPVPVLTTDVTTDVTNRDIGLTIDFGETVTGFVSADVRVTNGTVTGFTDVGEGVFELTVVASGDGDVTLEVPASVAEDQAANGNDASEVLTVSFDGSGPVLVSSAPVAGATDVSWQSDLSLTFDEPVFAGDGELVVQDVTAGDEHTRLAIPGAGVSIDGMLVTVALDKALVPTHEYSVTFSAGSLEDEAGNGWGGIQDDTAFRFTVGNLAPEAGHDSATLTQGSSVALDVLANDRDEEGRLNPASVRIITPPAHGRVDVETSTGALTYQPQSGYTGEDALTYVVEDEFGDESNVATVSLTAEPAGLPPVTLGDTVTVLPGGTVVLSPLANDRAGALEQNLDPQSVELVLRPQQGSAQWTNGELSYTADEGFEGVETLAYTVADTNGVRSAATRLFINVSSGAAAPVARDDEVDTEVAAAVSVDVLANDEAAGGALVSASVELGRLPGYGVAEVDSATGQILYTPDADFRGEDRFSYTVRDDRGLVSEAALVTVSVGQAGVPVTQNDQVQVMDNASLAINVLGNDRGLDSALDPATLSVQDGPAKGVVTLDAGTGVFRYTPDETFDGMDSFTYTVRDQDGQLSAPATVLVTDQPGNNRPLANDRLLAVAEDTAIHISPLDNDQDLNGSLLPGSLTIGQQPLRGILTLGGDGTASYTPQDNFYGEDRFTYTVADDTGRESRLAVIRLVVSPVPDKPLISGSPTPTISVGSVYRFTPVATDTDSNPLTFSVTNLPGWATFDDSNGRISGTPELDDLGSYGDIVISVNNGDESSELSPFSIQVTDNSGGSGQADPGAPVGPVAPGSEEGSDIPVVDPESPAVGVSNDQWPSYTEDQPSKARYETTFVDAAGEKRKVSVTLDDPQAPLPFAESPDIAGRQTLTFGQSDGSEQTVAVTPSGETIIAVYHQAGDSEAVSVLTSDAATLKVTVLSGGDMRSEVETEGSDGGASKITVVQSSTDGVFVSGTLYSPDGILLTTTAVQFDLVPAQLFISGDGTVSVTGAVTAGSGTTAVEYRITSAGAISTISQYQECIDTPVSSAVNIRQGGSVGLVMADGYISIEQPYAGADLEHQATVTSDGQLGYVSGSGDITSLPAGSILTIDADQATTGGRDLDPDGNGLNRAAEISGSSGGQPSISRLEVTDVENGNELVVISPALDGDGFTASRLLADGELAGGIRLDGTSLHRLTGRAGKRDNEARSLVPGSLSLFFNDRIVTVKDEGDTTFLTELLGIGEVRHEVAAGGESTRAFSYLAGSSTVIERDSSGLARVVTRAVANGRSLEARANADGSANHRLINRLGEPSEADIRIPGAFTSLNENGSLQSRVRLEGTNVCAWVETFGNGETGTGFGVYDPVTLTCQNVQQPTSQSSLFEAGNSVTVESDSGEHNITVETRVTRPIRF